MKKLGIFIGLAVSLVFAPALTCAQDTGVDPMYQTAPTVTGGTSTGLFQTYSTRTLRRGQYNWGVFWHNYDRDPGDLDINRIPVNYALGLTDRTEAFVTINFFQQVTTRQPFLLSGSVFNERRINFGGPNADPFATRFFSPPRPHILPPVGAIFEAPDGRLFGPFDAAGYYNEFPFFPFADASGPRMSSNGLGDITFGIKRTLTDPDRHFSIAAAGLIKIPSARKYDALADGRGAGAVDGGPVLILSQQAFGHRLRFHQNIGYMFTGSIRRNNINILDRRDELMLNTGIEIAPWDQVVYLVEWTNTVLVGSGTPNLNPVNPMDLRLGARFYFFDGRFHIGGAWQTFLNNADGRQVFTIEGTGANRTLRLVNLRPDEVNGFVVHVGYGKRPPHIPPPPPNRPPTVNLESDRRDVMCGDRVTLIARATDPDNDVLIYSWSTSAGQIVGSGPTVTLDTTGVTAPGAPPTTVTITVTVDDGRGGSDTATTTITVSCPPPPPPPNRPPVIESVTCSVIGTPQVEGQITDGEIVRVRAIARDPDGDPLTYEWTTTAGRLRGTGPEVTLDTTNVTAGPGAPPVPVTISVSVADGRGGTATASTTCTVFSVKKPEAVHLEPDLRFRPGSARVDNVHKAILDDVALRLQQDPTALLVVDGHQDRRERRNLSRQRAENVKRYLVRDKGIDANRIVVRAFGANRPHPSGDRRLNRRVELWLVPSGADMPK